MRKKSKPKQSVIRHFILVEDVPVSFVGPELMQWGEGPWWPKKSLSHFTKISSGDLAVGTVYKQKILKPLMPSWKIEVTRFEANRLIERAFVNGMFRGFEIIKVEERPNGSLVNYELHYSIKGLLNKILWPRLYQKYHDKNTVLVLEEFKKYVLLKYSSLDKENIKK